MIKLSDLHEMYEYQKISDEYYTFKVNDKIIYFVKLWHDSKKHSIGTYEIEFGIEGQEHYGEIVNLGTKHVMTVLYTIANIIETTAKEQQISIIRFEGDGTERDLELGLVTEGPFLPSSRRAHLYSYKLKRHYGEDTVKPNGRWIEFNVKKALKRFA